MILLLFEFSSLIFSNIFSLSFIFPKLIISLKEIKSFVMSFDIKILNKE